MVFIILLVKVVVYAGRVLVPPHRFVPVILASFDAGNGNFILLSVVLHLELRIVQTQRSVEIVRIVRSKV